MACLFGHKWNGCKCEKCGKIRDTDHQWDGCKCLNCGKTRDEGHDWKDGKCTKCGKIDFKNKFLIFVAYVGVMELVSMYGHNRTKDMIGIDKVDWKDILINKYPLAKSMTQVVINDNEWTHPVTGNVDSRVDMNPFLIAVTKHLTDNIGITPEEATNAIMITANNNITVAAGNGLGLGQGFVVIGVPFN